MKKSIIAVGILILLATIIRIEQVTFTANRLREARTAPNDNGSPALIRTREQISSIRSINRERIVDSTDSSLSSRRLEHESQLESKETIELQPSKAIPEGQSSVRSVISSGGVALNEVVIDTVDTGSQLQSTFTNESPLTIAIRFNGELFKLDPWTSKSLLVPLKSTRLGVFVWGHSKGNNEWQAEYLTVITPRPGTGHFSLNSNNHTADQPPGAVLPDDEP